LQSEVRARFKSKGLSSAPQRTSSASRWHKTP
jgi:hypothetical protein